MKKLDIPSLEAFVAAVEEKSLSRAAQRENLVTSAVSKRITDLEHHLDKVLLSRHGRGVEPTPAGMLLYQHAKSILRNLRLTENLMHEFANDGKAKIRLLANPSTVLQFLPQQLAPFLKSHTGLRIDLVECHSYDIPRLIAEDSGDIGVYHADQPATGVLSFPYTQDRVGLVVPNGHPLTQRESLFLEEALDYDLLGYFPRHSLDSFLAYVEPSLSRPPNVNLQVSNFESRCRMIMEGLGIGVVPEKIAANYLQPMGLKLLHLKDSWARRQFYVCVKSVDSDSPLIRELLDALRQHEG